MMEVLCILTHCQTWWVVIWPAGLWIVMRQQHLIILHLTAVPLPHFSCFLPSSSFSLKKVLFKLNRAFSVCYQVQAIPCSYNIIKGMNTEPWCSQECMFLFM